jgi:hypothetical protein
MRSEEVGTPVKIAMRSSFEGTLLGIQPHAL